MESAELTSATSFASHIFIFQFVFFRQQVCRRRDHSKNPHSILLYRATMMHPSTVLLLLLSVVAPSSRRNAVVVGYTMLPIQQRSSNFVGRDVLASPPSPSSSSSRRGGSGGGANIEMKKGKANLPSHMRSQYKRSQEMEAYRQQMIESQVSGRRWLVDSARKWDACADLLSPPLPSPYRRPVFLSFATRHILRISAII